MFISRSRGRGRGGGRDFHARQKVPLKGLFADGLWQCNCEPRLPAEHFQTNNGGKNHGRWFYTCQKSQPKRCDFFLWDDEAKPREASAVLNNSRSEPQTPTKPLSTALAYTTPSNLRRIGENFSTPGTPSTASFASESPTTVTGSTEIETFDWPDSNDDELFKDANKAFMPPPETPRKAIKRDILSTPGKRRYNETTELSPSDHDDVFSTPATSRRRSNLFSSHGLMSPITTHPAQRFRNVPIEASEIGTQILGGLQELHVPLPDEAIALVKGICYTFTLRAQGIVKGRDISRMAIKAKDSKIVELQENIAALEAERETNRAVIRHLRRDIETVKGKNTQLTIRERGPT